MSHIVSVFVQKGGVGKTTITFNVGLELAKTSKVLLIDNDAQKNLTAALTQSNDFQLTTEDLYDDVIEITAIPKIDNLYFVPSSKNLYKSEKNLEISDLNMFRKNLEKLKTSFDYIFIDCPPNLGNLSTASLIASDYILIPFEAGLFCYQGLSELVNTINKTITSGTNPNLKILGLVINKFESTIISNEIKDSLISEFKDKVFKTLITKSTKIIESQASNKSIIDYDPSHKVSLQFRDLIQEIKDRLR